MKWFVISNIIVIVAVLVATQYVFSKEESAMPAGGVAEVNSPADHIKEDQIKAYEKKVEISFDKKTRFVKFVDTNSMDPVLDAETNAIEVIPDSSDEINKGDIISYKSSRSPIPVIHRVVEVNKDENGWFAIVKGDNNPEPDPEKVRFHQINGVVVALFY
ncbi:MAG: signal peptidase I [Candidatus Woesearchaeota archaeon]